MEPVLIVAATEKSYTAIGRTLTASIGKYSAVWSKSSTDARRRIAEGEWALIVINAPLADEFGMELAIFAAMQTSAGVILMVKSDMFEEISEQVIDEGVIVIPKPLSKIRLNLSVRHALAVKND